MLSPEGFADLVAALEEETGSSTVFEAVLYPGYAVVNVPVDATSARSHSFYWDGELDESGSKSTTTYERFDLADIDPTVVVSVVDQARAKVEDPQTWYSIIRAPSRHRRRHLDLGLRDQRVRRVRLPRQRPGGHHHLGPHQLLSRILADLKVLGGFEGSVRRLPNPPASCYRTVTPPNPDRHRGTIG